MDRTTRALSALALGATLFAGMSGTASAQTREHVLLARQPRVPAAYLHIENIAGEDDGGAQDCWDWTDAETGEPMSDCR